MAKLEQMTAPGYPGEESQIILTPLDLGLLEAEFEFAIGDHGNDRTVSWPSYTQDETFQVYFDGIGDTLLEGKYWCTWLLHFANANKTLRIDVGRHKVERFEAGEFVLASTLDMSDIVAAYFNLQEFKYHRRLNGWDPMTFKLEWLKAILDIEGEENGR